MHGKSEESPIKSEELISDNVEPKSLDAINKNKKELKGKVLQIKASELQKKIDNTMDKVETMCQEYAVIMNELAVLNNMSDAQKTMHDILVGKLMGDTPDSTADEQLKELNKTDILSNCNTTEEMLKVIQQEIRNTELSKLAPPSGHVDGNLITQDDIIEAADQLANVDATNEVWDRMAKAHQERKLKDEEKSLPNKNTNDIKNIKEESSVSDSEEDSDNTKEDSKNKTLSESIIMS